MLSSVCGLKNIFGTFVYSRVHLSSLVEISAAAKRIYYALVLFPPIVAVVMVVVVMGKLILVCSKRRGNID
jgi:hypothetical protein